MMKKNWRSNILLDCPFKIQLVAGAGQHPASQGGGGGIASARQGGGGTPSPVTSLLPLHVGSKRPTGYSPAFDTVSLQNITVPSVGHGALDFKSQQ